MLANEKINMNDQSKTMEKNWNLVKTSFNNTAEFHAILKALTWVPEIFQNTQEFLNQEIWIFSHSQNAFKSIKKI